MTIPILVNLGYDRLFVTAMVAVSGGGYYPASIPFIMYAFPPRYPSESSSSRASCRVFLIGACLMAYAFYYCKKNGEIKKSSQRTLTT
jgi:C4-dicarboxylate transporter DctM subunit